MNPNLNVRFPADEVPEPRLIFPVLDYQTAWDVGSAIREQFLETYKNVGEVGGPAIAIQISLFSGHDLFRCAVGNGPSVGPGNWEWARGKLNTVRKAGISSWAMRQKVDRLNRQPEEIGFPFPEYAVAGGGVPIWAKGVDTGPIGAVIVSGLPQREDHQLIHNAVFSKTKHLVEPPTNPEYITADFVNILKPN